MIRLAKGNIKFILLVLLAIYSASYFYDEVTLGGLPTVGYIFFNLPLGIILICLAVHLYKKVMTWQKVVVVVAILISVFVLIPPYILKVVLWRYPLL